MITHKQAVLLAIIEEQTLGAYEIAVEYARRMKMETNHAWPYFDSTVAQLHLLWGAGLVRYQAIDKGGIGYHNYTAYTATLAGFDNLFQFRQTLGITPREDTHAPSECGDESKTASGIYRCTLAQGHEGGHHDHLDDGVGWSK